MFISALLAVLATPDTFHKMLYLMVFSDVTRTEKIKEQVLIINGSNRFFSLHGQFFNVQIFIYLIPSCAGHLFYVLNYLYCILM